MSAAPVAPVPLAIPDRCYDEDKKKLRDDFAALEKSYADRFGAYRLWLDEDARAVPFSALVWSIGSSQIVDFDRSHRMWSFLRDRYEPSVILATLPPFVGSSCYVMGQQSDIELQRTYVLLTRLRDEYEPLRAQLLARHPFVSLIDALAAVRNEEIRLRSAGLLPSVSALAARSAPSRPAAPSLPSSPAPVPPSSARGGGGRLHCDYCGKDGHVEAFCYRKKKAQLRSQTSSSSQSSGSASAGVSQRSSTDPVTQEMLMLLRRLAAPSPSGTASVATLPAGSPGSAAASQSSTQGPPGPASSSFRRVRGSAGSALAVSTTSSFDRWHHRLGHRVWLPFVYFDSSWSLRFGFESEYLADALRQVLSAQGTLAQFSCPGAHAQNGVAERKHRHLLETARALMLASSVPPHFWAEAVSTATYLINIQPSSSLRGGIPLERLCGTTPDYSDLRLFSCVCYVLLAPRERTKLTAQSVECAFLGYSAEHKGYRCWDPVGRRMRISRDVVFDESRPFYPRPSADTSLASLVDPLSFLFIPDTTIAHTPSRLVPSPAVPASDVVPPSVVPPVESSSESSSLPPDYTTKPPVTQVYTRRSTSTSSEPSSDEPLPAASSSEQLLGRGHRSRQPVDRYGFGRVTWQGFAGTVLSEPLSYRDAILHPEWQLAMAEEIAALERTGTWDLVPTPSHIRPITCKLRLALMDLLSAIRLVSLLVVFGGNMVVIMMRLLLLVAHMTTVRALLPWPLVREWSISRLDVKNAFLNGELREEVYMQPPPRVFCSRGYGSSCLVSAFCVRGHKPPVFLASVHDPALFVHTSSRGRTLLLLYVDDMIITGDDPRFIAFVKARPSERFLMSDLGSLRYFLGIEISSTHEGIYLSREKYIRVFLIVLLLPITRPRRLLWSSIFTSLAMMVNFLMILLVVLFILVLLVPTFLILVHIRVGCFSLLLSSTIVIFFVSYVIFVGLCHAVYSFHALALYGFGAYRDATWASDSSDRRSLSRLLLRNEAFLVRVREAELRAMALVTAEVTWLRWLLADFGVSCLYRLLFLTDKTGAISIARDPVKHELTKHIGVDAYYTRARVRDDVITLRYVPSNYAWLIF
ncbi:hypothetical protein U9M48_010330 [Paspalum notatum var. saurae]|uniref:Integrase catalytic domain-containing protein n=1 Tax=Paspalum notatum var. saurae TaxID=547442 RepID=A0AAQ3SSW2_PASNO